jgi:hypothetical protein
MEQILNWHCINKFRGKCTQPNGAGFKWHCTNKFLVKYTQSNGQDISATVSIIFVTIMQNQTWQILSGTTSTRFVTIIHSKTGQVLNGTVSIKPLTPELNRSPQRCLTRFLPGILLLEQYISLTYAWKTNKCTNYSLTFLIMYDSIYLFRHYIAIYRERS